MIKEVGIATKNKETSSQIKPIRSRYVAIMYQPVTVSSNMYCTNKAFSSTSTRLIPCLATHFIPAKVRIKSCRCARECFICTCIWLHVWVNSYRLVHYSYIVISNWFKLTSCFLTFCWNPYFLSQIWIFLVYLVNIFLCTEELTCYEVMNFSLAAFTLIVVLDLQNSPIL